MICKLLPFSNKMFQGMLVRVLFGLCLVFGQTSMAREGALLTFDLAGEEKTVGDIKPAFIVYSEKDLPDVSIEYVLKRYIKLFETTSAPDVKVDALNRINNLRARFGVDSKKLEIDRVKQSQAVLDSYDSIVDSGVFYERMDELLYQTAKASAFVGNPNESIKRLKLLVGLYPNSPLVDESHFRIGEAYFDLGDYAKAEAQYKKLIAFSETGEFEQQARFKLGWSVFRQDRYQESAENAFKVLDVHPVLADQTDFSNVKPDKQDLVEDTLRLLAIVFSKQNGPDSIETAQSRLKTKRYAYLLYDALFRFYLKQDRFEEAALVASRYGATYIDRFNAHTMARNAIAAYSEGEFDIQTWSSKEDYVENFGVDSHFWSQRSDEERESIRAGLSSTQLELAHLYYTRMQNARAQDKNAHRAHGLRAAAYYQSMARLNPDDDKRNGGFIFLAGEALRDIGSYEQAIALYERSAYKEAPHEYSEQAAYLAITSFDELEVTGRPLTEQDTLHKRKNIFRFAESFEDSDRTPELLAFLSGEYFAEKQFAAAREIATRVVSHPKVRPKTAYRSNLIEANSYYELQAYAPAEISYSKVLDSPLSTSAQTSLRERLAASIYKQAERAEDAMLSAALFLKVAERVPGSEAVPQALYDASAKFLSAGAWSQAIVSLNSFQSRFPNHSLNRDASEKLVYAYTESGDLVSAADTLVVLSDTDQDPALAAERYFQATEYYGSSGLPAEAFSMCKKFIKRYSDNFKHSIDCYERILTYVEKYDRQALSDWRVALVNYESGMQEQRTVRSATLAGQAQFALGSVLVRKFEGAKLTVPLKKSLQTKRTYMDEALAGMKKVASYGIAELQSAATYTIAGLYRSMAADLMSSERPSNLNELQLEQYDILLEEQAYPFEEQAIEVFMLNAERAAAGEYNDWVRKSFKALADISPTTHLRTLRKPDVATEMF